MHAHIYSASRDLQIVLTKLSDVLDDIDSVNKAIKSLKSRSQEEKDQEFESLNQLHTKKIDLWKEIDLLISEIKRPLVLPKKGCEQ